MKFAHLADTHIRNLKYHKEYREIFSKLYDKIKQEKVDYIIHCGDIAHTKTQISPEFVDLCSNFLNNLANIAPTYVILGNHDGNLRNSNRQDALTPIANALQNPNLHLLKNSGEVALNDEFAINVLSVFDRDNWRPPSSSSRINIALYHGSVSGVVTDTGWKMESGEDDVKIFNNFDYGFLGDIHKTNQIVDKHGKVRYPGSTVQQNHGETNDKGFLVWDIESKDSYTCVHHVIENPKPFVTVKLTPKGRLPNKIKVKTGARLRLLSENNLPLDVIRRVIDAAKTRFQPEVVTYLSRAAGERGSVENLTKSGRQEDLRDVSIQERFIQEYLSDHRLEDQTLKKVFEMNKKYNALVEKEEEVYRNINWKLKCLEWDNLFNYGESNKINFEALDGIVGILGKNFSGKSSVIDSLLYTVYNTTSKNNRKNLNLINQNEEWCRGYAEITVGHKVYKIERTSKKYKKRLKGKETWEAKTDVDFLVFDTLTDEEKSLNGVSRMETDKNIRKVFGSVDDFFLTSMSSQLDSLSYLNEGSTKRKEILAKFLDLEFFDRKFKMVNEDSTDLKGAIKKFSDRDYDTEIQEAREAVARSNTELMVRERELSEIEEKISNFSSELENTKKEIQSIPKDLTNIRYVKKQLRECLDLVSSLKEIKEEKTQQLEEQQTLFEKIENFINGFDIISFTEKREAASAHEKRIVEIEEEISKLESKKEIDDNKIDHLKKAPCSFSVRDRCLFVKDAKRAIDDTQRVRISLNQLSLNKETIKGKVLDLNPNRLDQYIEKYHMLTDKRASVKERISSLELQIEKNNIKLLQAESLLADLGAKESLYEDNRESIENFEILTNKQEELDGEINKFNKNLSSVRKNLLEVYKNTGSLEQKYEELVSQKKYFLELQDEFTVADLYIKCMHPNGISYDIIKKRLPRINNEISKILTNIVDFEIFFENDENKLDILIKHPKHDPRPIEMGSGAEKTIGAMAIRLALLNVSTLPKGDVFILDEPGTALDAENMEGFIRILDMIKTQFKTIVLISHLDSLKDVVDKEIAIEKNNGVAHIHE